MSQNPVRGAPSTVKNFTTSSGGSMGAAPEEKETVTTVFGVSTILKTFLGTDYALFSRVWGSPTAQHLEIQNLQSFQIPDNSSQEMNMIIICYVFFLPPLFCQRIPAF